MILQKRWVQKDIPPVETIDSLSEGLKVRPLLATLIAQKGLKEYEEARVYFNPSLENLHDPFLMKDMQKAVKRISEALEKREKILVYGDYDVDGTTAVALVYSFLHKINEETGFYIPDRASEGYGISFRGIDFARDNNFSLVIALDCGIKANEKVAYARQKDIDFIICDHHTPGDEIPAAVAILDPKQQDCPYPYKELSGCGIGFKLLQALVQYNDLEYDIFQYLDLVAASIASDIVPITGENRILAHFGLLKVNTNPSPGLKSLIELSALKNALNITDLVFKIGPRLNAAGRIADAKQAVLLLIADKPEEALQIARDINKNNTLRQAIDSTITEQAMEMISASQVLQNRKTTVLFNPAWHKGVIGIVASRLIEKYYRPTVMLTESNGVAVGSARSVKGYNLYEAVAHCSDLLVQFGGHHAAAGLTMQLENLEAFSEKFEQVVNNSITDDLLVPVQEFDLEIHLNDISMKFSNTLQRFGPFGPENMQHVFVARGVQNYYAPKVVGEHHLKLSLRQDDSPVFNAIGFGLGAHFEALKKAERFDICFTIEENTWNGVTSLQLNIKDLQIN